MKYKIDKGVHSVYCIQFHNLKSVTSRMIRKEYPEVKKVLWKGTFWSPSYFLASVGQISLDDLKKYVETQGK